MRTLATLDLGGPLERWSRIVCQRDGPHAVVALESRASRGPWAVVDRTTGETRIGRGITPVTDGRLDADGSGVFLTYSGLTFLTLEGTPRLLRHVGEGFGRGKERQEHELAELAPGTLVVGRRGDRSSKVVDRLTGAILGQVPGAPPFLVLPSTDDQVRLWLLGSGQVVTLDPGSWTTLRRETAQVGLAACVTPSGVVALLGTDRGSRLVRLGPALDEEFWVTPGWLRRALPDPDWWGTARLTTDGSGRAVLLTTFGLTVLDPESLERVAESRTDHAFPACWPGTSTAVAIHGETQLRVLDWSRG